MAPCVPPAKCLLGFWVVGDLYLFWFELWTVPQPTCVFYMCCWVLWVVVESSRRLLASRAGMDGWHPQKSLPWNVELCIFPTTFTWVKQHMSCGDIHLEKALQLFLSKLWCAITWSSKLARQLCEIFTHPNKKHNAKQKQKMQNKRLRSPIQMRCIAILHISPV